MPSTGAPKDVKEYTARYVPGHRGSDKTDQYGIPYKSDNRKNDKIFERARDQAQKVSDGIMVALNLALMFVPVLSWPLMALMLADLGVVLSGNEENVIREATDPLEPIRALIYIAHFNTLVQTWDKAFPDLRLWTPDPRSELDGYGINKKEMTDYGEQVKNVLLDAKKGGMSNDPEFVTLLAKEMKGDYKEYLVRKAQEILAERTRPRREYRKEADGTEWYEYVWPSPDQITNDMFNAGFPGTYKPPADKSNYDEIKIPYKNGDTLTYWVERSPVGMDAWTVNQSENWYNFLKTITGGDQAMVSWINSAVYMGEVIYTTGTKATAATVGDVKSVPKDAPIGDQFLKQAMADWYTQFRTVLDFKNLADWQRVWLMNWGRTNLDYANSRLFENYLKPPANKSVTPTMPTVSSGSQVDSVVRNGIPPVDTIYRMMTTDVGKEFLKANPDLAPRGDSWYNDSIYLSAVYPAMAEYFRKSPVTQEWLQNLNSLTATEAGRKFVTSYEGSNPMANVFKQMFSWATLEGGVEQFYNIMGSDGAPLPAPGTSGNLLYLSTAEKKQYLYNLRQEYNSYQTNNQMVDYYKSYTSPVEARDLYFQSKYGQKYTGDQMFWNDTYWGIQTSFNSYDEQVAWSEKYANDYAMKDQWLQDTQDVRADESAIWSKYATLDTTQQKAAPVGSATPVPVTTAVAPVANVAPTVTRR